MLQSSLRQRLHFFALISANENRKGLETIERESDYLFRGFDAFLKFPVAAPSFLVYRPSVLKCLYVHLLQIKGISLVRKV